MTRLIAIQESFSRPLPDWLTRTETKRFYAELFYGERVTVVEYALQDRQVEEAILCVSELLLRCRYYAHIVTIGRLIVAFRRCVFRLDRGDAPTIELCRTVGRKIGIPDQEMRFEEMFDVDHPDLPNHD